MTAKWLEGCKFGFPVGRFCCCSLILGGSADILVRSRAFVLTNAQGRTRMSVLVRLRAHLNRRVKVPDLAITLGPVTESNCAGAIPPGGKQLEVNEQSVTRLDTQRQVNSIRSAVLASLRAQRRSPNEIVRPALREWIASGREPQMVGDGMFGSSSDVKQGTTAGGERASRGQSPRSGMSGTLRCAPESATCQVFVRFCSERWFNL